MTATTPEHSKRAKIPWLGLVVWVTGAAGISVLTLSPSWDSDRGAVVLVFAGTASFWTAAFLLGLEGDQRTNARLLWLAGGLFALDKAFAWPRTPLVMLGESAGWLYTVVLAVLLLRYPWPRLESTYRRALTLITALVALCHGIAVLTDRRVDRLVGAPFPVREVWWPTIVTDPALSNTAQLAGLVVGAIGTIAVVVMMRRRLALEGSLVRAELRVLWWCVIGFAAVLLTRIVILGLYPPSLAEEAVSAALQGASVMFIPLGFIGLTLIRRSSRGRVADLVGALQPPTTNPEIRSALRQTLGDLELEIYYATDEPVTGGVKDVSQEIEDYRSEDGVAPAVADRSRRVLVGVPDKSGRITALVDIQRRIHDKHTRLVKGALSASAIALSNAQLEGALRRQLDEVRDSRRRIAQASLDERRRLERDLHDGFQQRLLALGALLGQLSLQAQTTTSQRLIAETRDALRQARRELSELANGVHPAALTQAGLKTALQTVVEGLPIVVSLDVPDVRWSPPIEATAYFVICEGLTNITKHAHTDQGAVVVTSDASVLTITISDHGRGGAAPIPGRGLSGMTDRIAALGGELIMSENSDGQGTVLKVRLPCR